MTEPKKFSQLYAEWLLQECNEPVDEIEWLYNIIPKESQIELNNQFKEKFGYGINERTPNQGEE